MTELGTRSAALLKSLSAFSYSLFALARSFDWSFVASVAAFIAIPPVRRLTQWLALMIDGTA